MALHPASIKALSTTSSFSLATRMSTSLARRPRLAGSAAITYAAPLSSTNLSPVGRRARRIRLTSHRIDRS